MVDSSVPSPGAAPRERRQKKHVTGIVVSAKMQKTIVVRSEWRIRHPVYGKIVSRSTKFSAHDEKGQARQGDVVELIESRPLSKTKNWRLLRVVRRGTGINEAVSGVEDLAASNAAGDRSGAKSTASRPAGSGERTP